MNIRDFEYIIAIDKYKSFSKAADRCYISQPALSQQIAKIENQLDFQIFERDKKRLITTQKGKKLIEHSELIIHSYNDIKRINNKKITINIGLIPTICPYLLPHIVKDLHKSLPMVKFYFSESKTDELTEKLKKGEIDVAILAYRDDITDSKTFYDKLYEEEFMLALPKNSRLTACDFPKIIKEKRLILLEEGNCMSDNIRDICSIYQQNSFSDFFATNIETVKNMLKVNNGAALLPKLSCLDEKDLKILPFNDKKIREVGTLTRASSNDIRKTIRKIQETIRDTVIDIL